MHRTYIPYLKIFLYLHIKSGYKSADTPSHTDKYHSGSIYKILLPAPTKNLKKLNGAFNSSINKEYTSIFLLMINTPHSTIKDIKYIEIMLKNLLNT